MRFTRGVIKIPIRYLLVFVIVVATAFILYLHILKHQRSGGKGQCRVLPPSVKPRKSTKTSEKPLQSHPGCWKQPEVNTFEQCPHCFRPVIKNVSGLLHQVQYSTSLFPRGPPDLFKPKDQVQQDFITSYLITPSLVCAESCPYLVTVLLSVSDDVDQRTAVRATWASVAKTLVWPNAQLNAPTQVLFVLAHQTEHSHIKQDQPQVPRKYAEKEEFPTLRQWTRIKEEADRFGDILYLNMQDSYYNLTLKLLSAFKWVNDHCPYAKFVLKVDIDTFVNVPLLLDLLIFNEYRLEYSILGKIYSQDRVVRRAHKWAVDAQIYPPAIFPVYASGCAYVLSSTALQALVEVFPYFPSFHIEDAFATGILARVAKLRHVEAGGILFTHNIDYEWSRCDFVYDYKVMGTGVSHPFKLRNMWATKVYDDGRCAQHNLITMGCYCTRDETF